MPQCQGFPAPSPSPGHQGAALGGTHGTLGPRGAGRRVWPPQGLAMRLPATAFAFRVGFTSVPLEREGRAKCFPGSSRLLPHGCCRCISNSCPHRAGFLPRHQPTLRTAPSWVGKLQGALGSRTKAGFGAADMARVLTPFPGPVAVLPAPQDLRSALAEVEQLLPLLLARLRHLTARVPAWAPLSSHRAPFGPCVGHRGPHYSWRVVNDDGQSNS